MDKIRLARFANEDFSAPAAVMLWWCLGCRETHHVRLRLDPSEPGAPVWYWNADKVRPTVSPSVVVSDKVKQPDGKEVKVVRCHLFLRDGVVEFLDDCKHSMKGQKAALTEWPPESGVFQARFFGNGPQPEAGPAT